MVISGHRIDDAPLIDLRFSMSCDLACCVRTECVLFVQVFCVPVEERRFKEMMEQQFGEKGGTQAKICSNIMAETGTV